MSDPAPPDVREWRVGSRYASVLYAVNPDGEDEVIGAGMNPQVAAQIVAEHALCTTPYADDEHRGGSWVTLLAQQAAEIARLRRELEQGSGHAHHHDDERAS